MVSMVQMLQQLTLGTHVYHGHPPEGVDLLWRIGYDLSITPMEFDHD